MHTFYGKGKGKVHPITGHKDLKEEQRHTSTLLTSVLDGGGWSTARPGRFTPGKEPVPIVQEAGWSPEAVWTGVENLSRTGIRSPDRPARKQSLYRLSYTGPIFVCVCVSLTHTSAQACEKTQDEQVTFYYFKVASELLTKGNYKLVRQFVNLDATNVH